MRTIRACCTVVFSFLIVCSTSNLAILRPVRAASVPCIGNPAPFSGDSTYLAPNTTLHVNINLPGLSPTLMEDVQAGISSWAGTDGLEIVFDNSTGPGSVSVTASSTLDALGQGQAIQGGYAPGATPSPGNQITGGNIILNLGFVMSCFSGPCAAFNPNFPNADYFLQGLLAHEMGHVLGLGDAVAHTAGCTVQSNSAMGGQCGTNDLGDGNSPPSGRGSTPNDCDKAKVISEASAYPPIPPLVPSRNGPLPRPPGPVPPGVPPPTGGAGTDTPCYITDVWDDSTSTLYEYSNC